MYFHLQHNWQRTKDKNFTRLHSSPSQLDASSEVNVYFNCSALFRLKNINGMREKRCISSTSHSNDSVCSLENSANEPRWTITVRFLIDDEMKGRKTKHLARLPTPTENMNDERVSCSDICVTIPSLSVREEERDSFLPICPVFLSSIRLINFINRRNHSNYARLITLLEPIDMDAERTKE